MDLDRRIDRLFYCRCGEIPAFCVCRGVRDEDDNIDYDREREDEIFYR